MNHNLEAVQRFSNRVENYIKYRPGYPQAIIPYLQEYAGLHPGMEIADIGAGTGILSKMFLDHGCRVSAIEPNDEMRAAAEKLLASRPQFTSIGASAEATTLPDKSVDLIAAGQAYHWFDRERSKIEFHRILKPDGSMLLLWNTRDDTDPFIQAFEALTQEFALDYKQTSHTRIDKTRDLADFFSPGVLHQAAFENQQVFDLQGLTGRLLSSSYAPLPDHPNHTPMLAALKELFNRSQSGGQVTFRYITQLYWTRIA